MATAQGARGASGVIVLACRLQALAQPRSPGINMVRFLTLDLGFDHALIAIRLLANRHGNRANDGPVLRFRDVIPHGLLHHVTVLFA
jgi:hypothetical protein